MRNNRLLPYETIVQAASGENIISGAYTIQRPVMFVTGKAVTPSEQAFIDYIFSQTGYDVVIKNGYIPAFTPAA